MLNHVIEQMSLSIALSNENLENLKAKLNMSVFFSKKK